MRFSWKRISWSLNERTRRWALRRHGPDPAQLTLASGRIYIVPTASGFVYAALLATMLAGSMNYNNNLAFALTFLLAGVGIATIYHTHRTLSGLRLSFIGAEPVFAGDALDVRLELVNESRTAREEIFLDWDSGSEVPGGLPPDGHRTVHMNLATERRGLLPLPGLRLSTRAPLGLMRAWAWVHLSPRLMVYPRPARAGQRAARNDESHPVDGVRTHGDDDFAGLRGYRPGDSPRRIAWRASARSDSMLVREYRGGSAEETIWIDWDDYSATDLEAHISLLTRLVLDAFDAGKTWGLKLPGSRIEPAQGRDHLHHCLRCLSTAGLRGADA